MIAEHQSQSVVEGLGIQVPMDGKADKSVKRSFRSYSAKLHLEGNGKLSDLVAQAMQEVVTLQSVANVELLKKLKDMLVVTHRDDKLQTADLVVVCEPKDLDRAMENIRKPLPAPRNATSRSLAEPRYQNSYRLIECWEKEGQHFLRFRIAEWYSWVWKDKVKDALTRIDATIFQGLIRSWVRPKLDNVPKVLREGVCQKAAEQFNSYISLLAGEEQENQFPSMTERDPYNRKIMWEQFLDRVARNIRGFEYKRARDINPGDYDENDRRGDRLVNVDPEWVGFVQSPFPGRFPASFVKSDTVTVFSRKWDQMEHVENLQRKGRNDRRWIKVQKTHRRLYVCIPIFDGIKEDSKLAHIARNNPKLFWWKNHRDEFTPVKAFEGQKLPSKDIAVVVPLEYDYNRIRNESLRMEQALMDPIRKVCWSLLVERQQAHKGRQGAQRYDLKARGREWFITFATSREIEVITKPFVLGIHFQITPAISWTLMDVHCSVIEQGEIRENITLATALREKNRLESIQRNQKWVGQRQFAKALETSTYTIIHQIARLAIEKKANLSIEEITQVDKSGGSPQENSRFSLWNYATLGSKIEWKSFEDYGIVTISRVNDYILRFTCPSCRACRKAGQNQEEATTWREGSILHCRECDFVGEIPPSFQSQLVAEIGAKKLRDKL